MSARPAPRRLAAALLVLLAALLLAGALLVVLVRDEAVTGPGTADPAPSGGGNAVVVVGDERDARLLRRFAARIGAEDRPAVRAAGQAIVVRVRRGEDGARARVGGRELWRPAADDPALQRFLESGLGG